MAWNTNTRLSPSFPKTVLASRLTGVALDLMRAARRVEAGDIGGAYSHLVGNQKEIDAISFEIVRELGAIKERTR